MKISLLTFLIGCLCSLDSFAQPKKVIDTAQIKPVEILKNELNYLDGWNKRNYISEHFRYAFQIREFGGDTYEGLTVTIKETSYNSIYHVYLQNLKTKELEFISNRWVEDESKHSAKLFVAVKYFKDPIEFELLIIPTIKTAKGINHIESKSVNIRNGVAYFARGHYSREIHKLIINVLPC